MEILVVALAVVSAMLVVWMAWSAYQVMARVCPSCGSAGASEDANGDPVFELRPGEWRAFGFLSPKPVNTYWCQKCGHKFRVLKKLF